jgi:hypothetical protein
MPRDGLRSSRFELLASSSIIICLAIYFREPYLLIPVVVRLVLHLETNRLIEVLVCSKKAGDELRRAAEEKEAQRTQEGSHDSKINKANVKLTIMMVKTCAELP